MKTMKKYYIFILFNLVLLSNTNAQDQNGKWQGLLSKDSIVYKQLMNKINVCVSKMERDLIFEEDNNPDIYDISNDGNMSYIAVIGCFTHKMACKYGFDLFIFKWNKKKNKLYSIPVPKNYAVAYTTEVGEKGKFFRELYFIDDFYMSICNEAIVVQVKYLKNKIVLQPIHLAGHDVPYNIMKIIRNDKVLNHGKSMCDLEDITSIIKVETIGKKKYYYIRSIQDLKFQCDLEGINCKLIKK
jgi:hypothetical protein